MYTAMITLTAKPGYTFTGVAANSLLVAGAVEHANATNSNIVRAAFTATSP